MDCFIFHGVDHEHEDIYTFTKAKDQALKSGGPRILEATLPGLNSTTPSTGAAKPKGSLSGYLHLQVKNDKENPVVYN